MKLKKIFSTARREYSLKPFTEKQALANPYKLFDVWMREAAKSGVWDANAMTLSTIDKKGGPTSRIPELNRHIDACAPGLPPSHSCHVVAAVGARVGDAIHAHPRNPDEKDVLYSGNAFHRDRGRTGHPGFPRGRV